MSEVTKETRQEFVARLRKFIAMGVHPIGDLIPLLKQAADELDIQCKPESSAPLYFGACITDGMLHAAVLREEGGITEFVATAEIAVQSLYSHDCIAKMTGVGAIPESNQFAAKNAARYLWFWNNAQNVSFTYQVDQYTRSAVMGLSCGTLQDAIDSAMKNTSSRKFTP